MRDWAAISFGNQTVINRIMLRFRPIAPKPAGGGAASSTEEQSKGIAAGRRVKRKYVRADGRQSKLCGNRKFKGSKPSTLKNSGVEDESPPMNGVVTLQLLGERSENDLNSCGSCVPKSQENWKTDRYSDCVRYKLTADSGGRTADLRSIGSVIETWIIVESVTDKFMGAGLGFSDKEKIYVLEQDTCPSFVSDWTNNVIWVNEAYKKMVAEDDNAAAKGFLVRLVVKDELPHICPSFACRVRVTQQKGQGQIWNKILPCDVWRLEYAGLAWKLDVNTALRLGF